MRGTLVFLLTISTAFADSKPGDAGTPEFEAATKLIRQLGAARYITRETAAKQLLDMRATAIPALTTGTSSPDEEIRNRCTLLLPQVKAADWKSRAEVFLADPDGSHKRDPVLFADYEKVFGKLDDSTRKLFTAMLRADLDLLVLAASRPEGAAELLRERCRTLMVRDPVEGKGHVPVRGKAAELATLFYLHDREGAVRAAAGGNDHPAYQLANPGLADGMAAADIGPALRRVVVRWAESRPADDKMAHQFFALAAGKQTIPEAVPLLTRLAKDKQPVNFNLCIRVPAVWALGRIGTPEATAALEGMISDRTKVTEGFPKGVITLGDCALAAVAEARGKAPSEYGLVTNRTGGKLRMRATTGPVSVTIALYWFPDEDARQDGLKKWKSDAVKSSPKAGR
jgi:hypothetical protein